MQLAHQPPEFTIDLRSHLCSGGTRALIEIVPSKAVFLLLDANDLPRSARPVEHAPIMKLATAARVERRAAEQDRALTGVQRLSVEFQQLRLVVAQIAGPAA